MIRPDRAQTVQRSQQLASPSYTVLRALQQSGP